MATQEHAHDDDHGEHLVPYKTFFLVWFALILLTGITVGVSYLDLKHLGFTVGLLIATIKCTLVLMYFMHMRWDRPVFIWFFIAAIGTYVIFVILTFADYAFR